MAELKVTEVFADNWKAIHEMAFDSEGAPILDDNGKHQRRYKYIINKGSSRSSKTFSMIDCYDLYARSQKNKRLTVWRDTKIDCKQTVLEDMLRHLKNDGRFFSGINFHETTSTLKYNTGSKIEIHGTDDEITVHGLNQDAAWLNEPYKISRTVFDQIDQRTTDFVFIDMNPLMVHWVDDLEKDKRAIVIHSTFERNPFCPPEQRAKILSYQPVSMCALVVRAKLNERQANEYDIAANWLAYPAWALEELSRCRENERKRSADKFNWEVYGLGTKSEKPNRIYRWDEVADSVYHDLKVKEYTASDWGVVDPWGVISAKYLDGCLYLHEHNYSSENEIKEKMIATELAQINAADEGIVKWLFSRIGIPHNRVIVCDDNRPLKIKALRQAGWEYAISAIKIKGTIIDGVALLNKIRVVYTASSTNIKYEQENYSRKVDKQGIVEEEPEDINNHLMDCARYIALFLQAEGIIRGI